MKPKLFVLVLVLVLSIVTVTPIAAAPSAAPCAPGAAYNPACDANQDGQINVTDIQLTAGHWNQTGTWVSDNNHTHLGQTWTGASNPLKLTGSYGAPDYAPLVVSNTAGDGLSIPAVTENGVSVYSAGLNGVYVGSTTHNGVYVASAGYNGVTVNSAGGHGVTVYSAGFDGVDVTGSNLAGYFFGPVQITGGCTGCLLATFGVNNGEKELVPGDLVSLTGLRESGVDSVPMLMEVKAANAGDAVVGVIQGWAELVTENEPRPTEIGLRLVPREGPADPGQYVTIAYSGLTQVKAAGPIAQGSKLTVGPEGTARAMRTVTVDGVELAENATAIGTALEGLRGGGLVWVLVNVQ